MNEPSWHDKQYLPSLSIPHTDAIFESWRTRAAATRAKLPFKADIAYGLHPRETLDFYPSTNAHGCIIYIHGGHWVDFSKNETSWVAEGFVGQGLSVALINYPLCPEVKIADIRVSCIKAFILLYQNLLSAAEREAVVVTGHSAGGYLAVAHMAEDWAAHGLPQNPIAGVLALSGLFDVTPLMKTSLNTDLRLDEVQCEFLNLNAIQQLNAAKLALAVGQNESVEFHCQSTELAKSWASLSPLVIDLAGANHFTTVDDLALPGSRLNKLAVAMARR